MELNIEKKKNPAEPDWNITVLLTEAERQKLLELLSLDTDKALKTFKNEEEFQIAQAADGEFTAILTVYPYPDMDEFYTPKDNGYGVVAVMHKDYEFEREARIGAREREILEKNRMATFDYPYYYTITDSKTKNVGYGRLCVR